MWRHGHVNAAKRPQAPKIDERIPIANSVLHPVTGATQTFRELINDPATAKTWNQRNTNEVARLAQGLTGSKVEGPNTIFFITHKDLPEGRKPTYLNIIVDYRPQKSDPNRVRWTVGGNLIDYPGNASTPTADMTTSKILMNSVLSTCGACYACFDLKTSI